VHVIGWAPLTCSVKLGLRDILVPAHIFLNLAFDNWLAIKTVPYLRSAGVDSTIRRVFAHHVPVAVLLMTEKITPSRSEFRTHQLRYQEQESGHPFFISNQKAYPFQTGGPGTFQFVLP